MKTTKVLLDFRTIIYTILFLLGLLLAWNLRGVILILFIAFILNAGLRPVVKYLESKKINRALSIFLTYLGIFIIFFILGFVIFSTAINQIKLFAGNIGQYSENLVNFINTTPVLNELIDVKKLQAGLNDAAALSSLTSSQFFGGLVDTLNVVGTQGFSLVAKFLGGLLSFFLVIIISAYMISNKNNVYERVLQLLPEKYEKKLNPVFTKIELSLGSWLLGQTSLMFIIGFCSYLIVMAPVLFDPNYPLAKYALVIAIIAGILEGLPNLGPSITLVLTILIAILSGAGIPAIIYIVVMFILLQQIEALVIVPAIMKKAVDLHPILSIIGVIAGFELGGPIGALLSVPIIGALQIIVFEVSKEWRKSKD